MKRKRLRTMNWEGKRIRSCMRGEIAPSGLIEFDNNLAGAKKFQGGRNEEKDVLASLALMVGNDCESVYGKRRKNEDAKLIAEKWF